MSLNSMVPGSDLSPDWRAVAVGGIVLGGLCLLPVLGGWMELPAAAAASPEGAGTGPEASEGPGLLETASPLLIGAPGPFLAGYFTRTENLKGAVEGMLSVPIGAAIPVVAAMIDRFLLFQGAGIGWQIEYVWRGVGAYAVIGFLFVPLVCILGAVLGWLGRLVRDAARGGVTVSWS